MSALESEALLATARRVVWFKPPEETLQDPVFFLAHIMTFGRTDDILVAQQYFSDADFEAVLDHAPAGIFDARSWAYWNVRYGHMPVPPLPRRHIPV